MNSDHGNITLSTGSLHASNYATTGSAALSEAASISLALGTPALSTATLGASASAAIANQPTAISVSNQAASLLIASNPSVAHNAAASNTAQHSLSFSHSAVAASANNNNNSSYVSHLETALLNAVNPLSSNELEEITINGEHGIFLNKAEISGWKGVIPLEKYPINQDACPQIIKKRAQNAELIQELSIKYLKPRLQPPGPITIRQEPNKNVDPAPPIIIRQQPKAPKDGGNKIFREIPPCLPKAPEAKTIVIPGKFNPPPPRKVIIEKLAGFPPKPDAIFVERWVEPDPVKRLVKFLPAPKPQCVPKPKNIIIEWEAAQVSIKEELKILGVTEADPAEYKRANNDLLKVEQLPEFAQKTQPPNGLKLASNGLFNKKIENFVYELEGDVQALGLIDLDKEGLSHYKDYLQKLGITYRPPSASEFDSKVQYCPSTCGPEPTPKPITPKPPTPKPETPDCVCPPPPICPPCP